MCCAGSLGRPARALPQLTSHSATEAAPPLQLGDDLAERHKGDASSKSALGRSGRVGFASRTSRWED